jgi:hypothetical protein
LGRRHGPVASGESLADWLARLHIGRQPAAVLQLDASFDIDDPYGGRRREYDRCAMRLDELVTKLVGLLAGNPVPFGR